MIRIRKPGEDLPEGRGLSLEEAVATLDEQMAGMPVAEQHAAFADAIVDGLAARGMRAAAPDAGVTSGRAAEDVAAANLEAVLKGHTTEERVRLIANVRATMAAEESLPGRRASRSMLRRRPRLC